METATTSHRQTLCDYLADLPLLDRQVLFHRCVQRDDISTIANQLRISAAHVDHILRRTQEFRASLAKRQRAAALSTWQVTRVPPQPALDRHAA